jgi:hypothetical protein
MAVSLNATMSAANSDSGRTQATGAATSFSFTGLTIAAGSNIVLLVTVGWQRTVANLQPTSRSVTWDGVAMTEAAYQTKFSLDQESFAIYVLVNPATGSKTLAGSWTTTMDDCYISAIAFNGADQTTGIQSADTGQGTSTSVATTGSADGATVGGIVRDGTTTASVTGKTIFGNYDGGAPGWTGAYEIGGTGTQTYDFSGGSDNGDRSAIAVHVIAASSSDVLASQAILW